MRDVLTMHGLHTESEWILLGIYMDYDWMLHRTCVDCAWVVCNIYVYIYIYMHVSLYIYIYIYIYIRCTCIIYLYMYEDYLWICMGYRCGLCIDYSRVWVDHVRLCIDCIEL